MKSRIRAGGISSRSVSRSTRDRGTQAYAAPTMMRRMQTPIASRWGAIAKAAELALHVSVQAALFGAPEIAVISPVFGSG